MIDLSTVIEIKNVLNNKIIDLIQDEFGNIIYEAWKTLAISGLFPFTLYNNGGRDLVDYKIYGNSFQGGLPIGYTKVAYIESVGSTYGNQYLNTGFVPSTSGFKVAIGLKASSTNTNTGCFAFGAYDATDGYKPSLYVYAQTRKLGVYFNKSSSKNTNITFNEDTDYDIIITTKGHNVDYNINNSTGSITTAYNPVDNNVPITLFTSYVGNTYILKSQISYFKIYDEFNNLVRDYVPCFRVEDSVAGMYDLINNTFIAQSGTGSLALGTATEPTPENPLEVQSIGTKTKNMLNVPTVYTFTGYPNLINNVDDLELNVQYRLVWTKTTKGSTEEIAINLGGNVGWIRTLASTGGSRTFTYTTLPTSIYLYANGANASASVGVTSTIEGLMITKSTATTAYEPYGYGIPIIATGKNLVNWSGYQSWQAYDTTYKQYTFNGKPNHNYTLSTTNTLTDVISLSTIENPSTATFTGNKTIKTGDSGQLRILVNPTLFNLDNNWQLEEGLEATGYQAYTEKTTNIYASEPLRKLGTAVDYIDYGNSKIVRKVATMTPTSSYAISTVTKNTNTILVSSIGVLPSGQYGTYNKVCNVFKTALASTEDFEHIRGANIAGTGTWLNIWINKSRLSGYTESSTDAQIRTMVRSWLVSNNFVAHYELATATQETVTLPAVGTVKDICYLSANTTIQPSNAEISYKGKDYTIVQVEQIDANTGYLHIISNQVTSEQNPSGGYTMTITGGTANEL